MQGEIIIVDGMPCTGKTTFLLEKFPSPMIIDSKEVTSSLYATHIEVFKILKNRNRELDGGKALDRDIIGVLTYFIYYITEKYGEEGDIEKGFGDNSKNTSFYELQYEDNFQIITNRNAIKHIIKNHLQYFSKEIKKKLIYFKANENIIKERLRKRENNCNSGTNNGHYERFLNEQKYFDGYKYSMELIFLLFKEVIKEYGGNGEWEIEEQDTSNL